MSDHYYSQKPTSKSNPSHFTTTLNDIELTFHTDEGVFSKKQVDYGTTVLLKHFQEPSVPGSLLDVGCGYGPIGITLAKQYPDRKIVMVDINERAVELTKMNVEENKVGNAEVFQSDGLTSITDNRYAAVITNPPFRAGKQVVHQMLEDSYEVLEQDGEIWVVVQKKQGAPSLKDKLFDLFGNAEIVKRDKGYFILVAKKFD